MADKEPGRNTVSDNRDRMVIKLDDGREIDVLTVFAYVLALTLLGYWATTIRKSKKIGGKGSRKRMGKRRGV